MRASTLSGSGQQRYPLRELIGGRHDVEIDTVCEDGILTQIKRITSPNGRFSGDNQKQFELTVSAVQQNKQSVFRYAVSSEAPEAFISGLRAMSLPKEMTLLIEFFPAAR